MNLLAVKSLSKNYHSNTVVKNITFTLQQHKCVALIGPNGAGKTTTLRMLTGLIQPSSGQITFADTKEKDYRRFIGYLPQHPVFHEWMTGEEFLVYVAKLAKIEKQTAKKLALDLLRDVGIFDAKNKRIGTYSGGMKQRLGIAQAMIHQPKLLLLDEPVSALDPVGRREVLTLIEKLKKEMTILFSTHILADADEVCDEVLLLHKGSIVESGEMDELRQKYKSSKIELVFTGEDTDMDERLKKLKTVVDVSKIRNTFHVSITNTEDAKQEILSTAANENWPLVSFNINQASLEDMFMKVVRS